MDNSIEKLVQSILFSEIRRAEKMVAYATGFEDKAAVGRWKMTVFQLRCLRKKLNKAFELLQEGASDDEIEDMLNQLDKELFMKGP